MDLAPHRAADPIGGFLLAVRRRLRGRQVLAGLALGLAMAAGALLTLAIGAALVPSSLWRALGGLALGGGAAWVAMSLWRHRTAWRSDDAVARYVGKAVPALGDELLSAVELDREVAPQPETAGAPGSERDPPSGPGLSRALVEVLRDRVRGRLNLLSPPALVQLAPTRRRAGAQLGAVGLAWAVAAIGWPGTLSRGWAELSLRARDRVVSSPEPIIGDLRLVLQPPAYTGLPAREIPSSSGQVIALPGTEVRLEARALLERVRSATLVLETRGAAPEEHDLEVRDGKLKAAFKVRGPGAYRFVLEAGGRRLREPEPHRIELDPDRPPRVELFAPGDPLELDGPRRIELAYGVDDDYGLGEVELVWRAGKGPEVRRVIRAREAGSRSISGKLEWDLAELEMKPGVAIAYHLEAKDGDTISGPNVGRSREFHLLLHDPRRQRDAAQVSEQEVLELALQLLGDRLELPTGDEARLIEELGRLHPRSQRLLDALAQADRAIGPDPRAARDFRRKVGALHDRLGKLAREEKSELSALQERHRSGGLKPGQARSLAALNTRQVASLEQLAITLDDLLGRQRLEDLVAVGDQLAQARDRLRQLMEQYRQSGSPALRQQIARELRELERKLTELRERAAKLATELPDQFLNREAMGKNDLQGRVDKLRELLSQGNVEQAMAELERLSSSLDRMMASLEGDLRGFRQERMGPEERALAELEDKVSDLEHDERQLKEETEAVQERLRGEAQRRLRAEVQPLLRRAREKVARLKKQLEGVEPRVLTPWDREELGRANKRVEDLDRMLEQADVEEARGMARQAQRVLKSMVEDARDLERRAWRGPPAGLKRARGRLEAGSALAREIADELDQAMPKPGELLSPDDTRRLGELAERQQATRRRLDQLQRELAQRDRGQGDKGRTERGQEEDGRGPLPQLGQGLQQAQQHMQRAEGRLRGRSPRDALGEEQQALDQLGQLSKQLREERRPREPMGGSTADKEPVRIPGAEEYRAPKEFRQDLLDAMKRSAPATYKDQVKRYYEELVK